MAEVDIIHEEFNDRNLHEPTESQSHRKLPKIDHVPSREATRSKAEKRKTPPFLPNIQQSGANLP
jgi:hypothetical protein